MVSWRLSLSFIFCFFLFLMVYFLQVKWTEIQTKGSKSDSIAETSHEGQHSIRDAYFIRLNPYFSFSSETVKAEKKQVFYLETSDSDAPALIRFNGKAIPLSSENRKALYEGKETLLGPIKNLYSGINEIFIEMPRVRGKRISSLLPILFVTIEILKEEQSLLKVSLWNKKAEHFTQVVHIHL